jgi:UDP-N-acetylglucosamine--N-acetylmuramyl-(pentapeptide) pyrophosphoryl-undecaprenol N-acetylglucosamine transferase
VIVCGGSGGHVHPAIAVADAWRRRVPDVEPLLVGPDEVAVAAAARSAGVRFLPLAAAPFARQRLGGKLRAAALATIGAGRAGRRLLQERNAGLVLGFGGYASAPAVVAAWSLGIPLLLHEANATAGLANRLAARLSTGVLLGFDAARREFAGSVRVTGTPIRPAIAALARRPCRAPETGTTRLLLVSGGSLGSSFLDHHVPPMLGRVVASGCDLEVLHLAGFGDVAATRAAYEAAGVRASVVHEIDDMAEAYARAAAAIVCAGAATLAEIAAAGVPAIVVPLGSAAFDHQTPNARAFAAATGARWSSERDWQVDVMAAHLVTLLRSPSEWERAAAGVRRFARPDATESVVEACRETFAGRAPRDDEARS